MVQTPPDTREEERERTSEDNNEDLIMVRLAETECPVSLRIYIHISRYCFQVIKVSIDVLILLVA